MMFFHEDINLKITKINSNKADKSDVFNKDTIKKGFKYFSKGNWTDCGVIPSGYTTVGSRDTGVTDASLSIWRWGAICVIDFNGTIKYAAGTRYKLYTLPNNWSAAGLSVCLGNDGMCKASMMALGPEIAFDFTTTVTDYTMRGALVCMIDDPNNY